MKGVKAALVRELGGGNKEGSKHRDAIKEVHVVFASGKIDKRI